MESDVQPTAPAPVRWTSTLLFNSAVLIGLVLSLPQAPALWNTQPASRPVVPCATKPTRLPSLVAQPWPRPVVLARLPKTAPRLPPGAFKPKQSLGQNFLVDPGTIKRIVDTFGEAADMAHADPEIPLATYAGVHGCRVLEVGPGIGALTDLLFPRYPKMQAVEIDQRAITQLQERHAGLAILHGNVLEVNFSAFASTAGGPLCVVGNLPYFITSDLLFCLLNGGLQGAIHTAGVTMQWEVAERLTAKPKSEGYGLLPISFALFSRPVVAFRISSGVFYPRPKVDSAFVLLHFKPPAEVAALLDGASLADLRQVLTAAFGQRRKKLRNSLLSLVTARVADKAAAQALLDSSPGGGGALPVDWIERRPEDLEPHHFIAIVHALFGRSGTVLRGPSTDGGEGVVLTQGETFGRP